jgi:hypothetical protein
MLAFRPVVATAQPHAKKSKDISRKLKQAIFHAKLICVNLKDAKECSVAWDQVEELSAVLNDQFMIEELSKRLLEVDEHGPGQ